MHEKTFELFKAEHYKGELFVHHWEEFVSLVLSSDPKPQTDSENAQIELEILQDQCLAQIMHKYKNEYSEGEKND